MQRLRKCIHQQFQACAEKQNCLFLPSTLTPVQPVTPGKWGCSREYRRMCLLKMYCIFGKLQDVCYHVVFSGLDRVSSLRGNVDVLLTAACEHLWEEGFLAFPPTTVKSRSTSNPVLVPICLLSHSISWIHSFLLSLPLAFLWAKNPCHQILAMLATLWSSLKSTTIGCIAMQLCTDIHDPQRINSTDFGDPDFSSSTTSKLSWQLLDALPWNLVNISWLSI